MRIKRKTSTCLNCGMTLDKVYNYCPKCGQGNHDDNVSFGTLVGDFFSTYFAVDSKFGKSFKPFFLKPGFLTNQYVIGKRETYAHPIRLYLIISIFYFFMVTLALKQSAKNDEPGIETSKTYNMLNEVNGLEDSTRRHILTSLSRKEKKQLKKALTKNDLDELKTFVATLDSSSQHEMRRAVGDSIANEFGLVKETDKKLKEVNAEGRVVEADDWIIERIDYNQIEELDKEYDLSDRQIYDSLALGELDYFDELMATQAIRIKRAKDEQIIGYVAKNLPIMMLLLIPIFALVLKLLYIRRKELYIKHLVHALHLHSFAYMCYGIFIILTVYIIPSETIGSILNFTAFLIVTVYVYISFLRVYKQHWFKTFLKFTMTGSVYSLSIGIFLIIEMMISLLLF